MTLESKTENGSNSIAIVIPSKKLTPNTPTHAIVIINFLITIPSLNGNKMIIGIVKAYLIFTYTEIASATQIIAHHISAIDILLNLSRVSDRR